MKELKQLTVNILGGRDVGKTTVAMHVVAELRWLGIPTALTYGGAKLWGEPPAVVSIRVPNSPPSIWTLHVLTKMCSGTMTFLVRRRKDYEFMLFIPAREMSAQDEHLEDLMREGRVQYKSLPGVRASVPYIIDRICKEIGYGK